jgi:DNA-binding protein HU-beta
VSRFQRCDLLETSLAPLLRCGEKTTRLPLQALRVITDQGAWMNKKELVAAVAAKAGLTKTQSARMIDSALTSIQEALANGDEVRMTGFGSFSVANRAAGEARNPRTGAPVQMPARKLPRFKAGLSLKQAVNT